MWWEAIIELLSKIFGLGGQVAKNKGDTIPYRIPSIQSEAKKDSIQDVIKIDRLQDRDLRKEPKEILEFETKVEYLDAIGEAVNKNVGGHGILFTAIKEEILKDIKNDFSEVLSKEQQRKFKRYIRNSDKKYFIIRISPLTIHQ